jgi:hypothetical protein
MPIMLIPLKLCLKHLTLHVMVPMMIAVQIVNVLMHGGPNSSILLMTWYINQMFTDTVMAIERVS